MRAPERIMFENLPSRGVTNAVDLPAATGAEHATGAKQTTGASAIDRAHLRRYTHGNADIETEILELFCSQSSTLVDQLKQATDAEAWAFASHSIKGSARAVGAWRVAELAERAERIGVHEPASRTAIAEIEGALVLAMRDARA
ncbi:MAG: Hpt domain-containing protein [Pseudomonadota bacterium]